MNSWQKILFVASCVVPLVIEGLGLPLSREVSYYLILIAPFLLFTFANRYHTLNLPLLSVVSYMGFLLFSLLSVFFAVNVQISFEYVLLYTAFLLVFIYSYNHTASLARILPRAIIFTTVILVAYAVYFYFRFPNNLPISPFIDGYNLVAAKYRGHNQLGDFLVIPLIIAFYYVFHKKHVALSIISVLFLLPFFILSYSRSAYIAVGVAVVFLAVLYLKKHSSRLSRTVVIATLISFFILVVGTTFAVTLETQRIKPFSYIHRLLPKQNTYLYKDLLGRREQYFKEGLMALPQNWVFGVGPGNFSAISVRYTLEPFVWTETSTSIFFDMLVEQGVIAMSFFLLFAISIFVYTSPEQLFWLLSLGLLINFQTNYFYRFYSIFFLFFIFAGQTIAHKKRWVLTVSSKAPSIVSLILLISAHALISHHLLLNAGLTAAARLIYPLSHNVYKPLIEQEINRGNYKNVLNNLTIYERLFQGRPDVFIYSGSVYERYGDKQTALAKYYHAYKWHPYEGLYLYQKIYALEKELNGIINARTFLNKHIKTIQKLPGSPTKTFLLQNVKRFCTGKLLRYCGL